jgi:hypothetical protein
MFLSNTKKIICILILIFVVIIFTILVLIKILHKKCKPITTCSKNGNCSEGSDGCTNTGKCTCPDGYKCDGNKCIPCIPITTCSTNGNCSEGSDGCTNTGKCTCPDGYKCDGNKCIPCIPITTCSTNGNCSEGSDGCTNTGKCTCPDGYTCMTEKCTEINFIAVGSGENNFAYSNDGINWISGNTKVFSTNVYGVIHIPSNNNWLAFGEGGTGQVQNSIFFTYDGKKWNSTLNSFFDTKGCACYKNICVAVGKIKNPYSRTTSILLSNDKGNNWFDTTNSVQKSVNAIAFNKNLKMWIVVGSDTNNNFSYSNSTDPSYYGVNWVSGKIDIGEINGIATNNLSNSNLWVAIGNKGTAYSSNGIEWTVSKTSLFSNPKAIACNGSLWVAVGYDSSGKCIAYSSDGNIWTYVKSNIFSNGAQGITWHDKKALWVAVGSDSSGDCIAYSNDGKNWTMAESKFFDNGGYGVASKNN